jgi:hypothetical protein
MKVISVVHKKWNIYVFILKHAFETNYKLTNSSYKNISNYTYTVNLY